MGSVQSRERLKLQCIFPTCSAYSQLPTSPTKQHLLDDDALNCYNLPEQYETAIRAILTETIINAKKVADLGYNIECLVSKNMALEENIQKCSTDAKKLIVLERTIECLLSKNALTGTNINSTNMMKVNKLEYNIELVEKFMLLDNKTVERNQNGIIANKKKVTELAKEFDRIEKLLLSETVATEGNFRKLRAKPDGLVPMFQAQNNMVSEVVEMASDEEGALKLSQMTRCVAVVKEKNQSEDG